MITFIILTLTGWFNDQFLSKIFTKQIKILRMLAFMNDMIGLLKIFVHDKNMDHVYDDSTRDMFCHQFHWVLVLFKYVSVLFSFFDMKKVFVYV